MISAKMLGLPLIIIIASIITTTTTTSQASAQSDSQTTTQAENQTPTNQDQPTTDTTDQPAESLPLAWHLSLITLTTLLYLTLIILAFRHPQALDKKGRPVALSLLTGTLVFGWFYLAVPIQAATIWQFILPNKPADYSTTIQGAATFQWLFHLLSIPLIFLWWWGKKLDTQRPPNLHHFFLSSDLHPHQNQKPRALPFSIIIAFPLFIAVALAVFLTNYTSAAIKLLITGEKAPAIAHSTLNLLSENEFSTAALMIILSVIIAAPIIEEVLYRGTLQATIRNFTGSSLAAIIISATIFASMHLGAAAPEALPSLFILAIFMGTAYAYTGRIITPIIIHFLFNLTNIILFYNLTSPPTPVA